MGTTMAQARAYAFSDPDQSRDLIIGRGMPLFAKGLIHELKAGASKRGACYGCGRPYRSPWAYRLFAQIAKLVDMGPQVGVYVFEQLGVNLPEAKRSVRIIQDVEALSEAEKIDEAVGFLTERGYRCVATKQLTNGPA